MLKYTNFALNATSFVEKKVGITWDNARLKDIIWHFIFYSEFMPKIWYNKLEVIKDNYKTILSETREYEKKTFILEEKKQN